MSNFKINDFATYKKNLRKITMVTAYDFHHAAIIEESDIDIILVGDSLGMVVQGKSNTLSVTLNEIIYHTQAVRKGAPNCFIVADMPYLTYHLDTNTTIQNAGMLISIANADAVKLEINHPKALEHIAALVTAQIPVIAHVGMTPQSINMFGGFKLQGKIPTQAKHIIDLAKASEKIGAVAIVVECVPSNLASQLTQELTIPTIGVGAGKDCDGQVLVLNDILGLTIKPPKFAKQYLNGRELISKALCSFVYDVQTKKFPDTQHSFN